MLISRILPSLRNYNAFPSGVSLFCRNSGEVPHCECNSKSPLQCRVQSDDSLVQQPCCPAGTVGLAWGGSGHACCMGWGPQGRQGRGVTFNSAGRACGDAAQRPATYLARTHGRNRFADVRRCAAGPLAGLVPAANPVSRPGREDRAGRGGRAQSTAPCTGEAVFQRSLGPPARCKRGLLEPPAG